MKCDIRPVGKRRDGKERFWCVAHKCDATKRGGGKLEKCPQSDIGSSPSKIFRIGPDEYPGGIGMWGAVAPIFDSTGRPQPHGIHVHARKERGGHKVIDDTFDAIELRYSSGDMFKEDMVALIEKRDAISFMASNISGVRLIPLFCIHCGQVHLDAEEFAVHPHKKHLCQACGREFIDTAKSVSNPICLLSREVLQGARPPQPVRPNRVLDVTTSDIENGVRVWASNPALLWTVQKPEEQGLHVHIYESENGNHLAVDDTFSEVTIAGKKLPEHQGRVFMAQKAMRFLDGRITSVECDNCGHVFYDEGEDAFTPTNIRKCPVCDHDQGTSRRAKRVVSNPFVKLLDSLKRE